MAALTMSKPKKSAGKGRVKLPVKRSINLAGVGEKPINMKIGIPAIILILLAAAALGKFGVADQITALNRAEREVESVKSRLSQGYAKIDQYSELEEKYAHYTFSGMTQEELSRVNRTEAVKMIERVVLPNAQLNSWSISGNQLTLSLSGKTLQEINVIAQRLEDEELVDYCQVTSAATDQNYTYYDESDETSVEIEETEEGSEEVEQEREVYHGVSAQVTAYLIGEAKK